MGDFVIQGTRFFIPKITVGGVPPLAVPDWSTYALEQTLTAPNASSTFSIEMEMNEAGDRMVVGDQAASRGYLYERTGTTWSLVKTFTGTGDYGRNAKISRDGNTIAFMERQASQIEVYSVTDGWTTPQIVPCNNSTFAAFELSGDGQSMIVGDGAVSSNRGQVTLYRSSGPATAFAQVGSSILNNPTSGTRMGRNLYINDDGTNMASVTNGTAGGSGVDARIFSFSATPTTFTDDGFQSINSPSLNVFPSGIETDNNLMVFSTGIAGYVEIHRMRSNTSTELLQRFTPADNPDGSSVGADMAAIGTRTTVSGVSNAGRVTIYQADDINAAIPVWSQVNTIDNPSPGPGQTFFGSEVAFSRDGFRLAVAFSQNSQLLIYRASNAPT